MKSNRQEQQKKLQQNIMRAQQGHTQVEGDNIYLFENHRNHDLSLPRKSLDGKTLIPPRGRFKGDQYFLQMLQTGYFRLISSEPYIKTPPAAAVVTEQKVTETVAVKVETNANVTLNENVVKESTVEKLILDQPEKFTKAGQTEQVHVRSENNLREINSDNNSHAQNKDVLLTENPLDGIDIIKG